ncbi:hypothetical protein KN10_2783 [Anoxybacillus flavithermus NBRC 109594]|uniref:Uncharacterized protein n=1 Tax=Anoxybacillus flavithermus NBRC 109594 TaxID=1315967 RepID=R4G7A6_9BACL|nr:hypothetical protein [Anoxybacillus flavithermus]GAC92347.1 hypothetical protein KN10_2783 [Anoxybacillus flavithermus NBRC 109594]
MKWLAFILKLLVAFLSHYQKTFLYYMQKEWREANGVSFASEIEW